MKKKVQWFIVVLMVIFLGVPVFASPSLISTMQAAIIFKVINHNRVFGNSAQPLVLGVIVDDNNAASAATFVEITKVFGEITGRSLHNRKIIVKKVPVSNLGAVDADVFFLARGLSAHVSKVTAFSQQNKVLTVTNVYAYMSQGVSVGVINSNAYRTQIFANKSSLAAEGVELDPQFMGMVRLMRR